MLAAPTRLVHFCTNMDLCAKWDCAPLCGSLPLEHLHLCPTFENLDAELSGKENHPHN